MRMRNNAKNLIMFIHFYFLRITFLLKFIDVSANETICFSFAIKDLIKTLGINPVGQKGAYMPLLAKG